MYAIKINNHLNEIGIQFYNIKHTNCVRKGIKMNLIAQASALKIAMVYCHTFIKRSIIKYTLM